MLACRIHIRHTSRNNGASRPRWRSPAVGAAKRSSSVTCSRPSSAAGSRRRTARSILRCAGSTRSRGGPGRSRAPVRARARCARRRRARLAPPPLFAGRQCLVRGCIDGVTLHGAAVYSGSPPTRFRTHTGVGLYAFVEAPGASERALSEFVAADLARKGAGAPADRGRAAARRGPLVRSEILELIAMNRIDGVDPPIASDAERGNVVRIVADPLHSARPHRLLNRLLRTCLMQSAEPTACGATCVCRTAPTAP